MMKKNHGRNLFTQRIVDIVNKVPAGRVATYGQIASYAGNSRAARQVAWILHSCSDRERLPWHRIVNARGGISLKPRCGYELQKSLLQAEGVQFDDRERIDLESFGWSPS